MTADTIGGVFTYAVELARGLSNRGVDVCLATLGTPPDRAQRDELRSIPGLSLFESRYALEWMDDPWRDVEASGEWLLELARQTSPDVVHLNGYSHAALPWTRPVVVVAHSCVVSFWNAVFNAPPPRRYDEYARRVARGLRAADVVVAPTRAMLSALHRHYGPLPHARVIANGASPERWPALDEQYYYLAAGRFGDPGKNLRVLELVAPRLPWPVKVAGELAARPEASNIESLGRLSQRELAVTMGHASVFVHPAHYEPFGLAPLEAACAGCALLLSDVESLREVWDRAALYFPPDDAEALTSAARFLARSERLRRRFATFARSRARDYSAQGSASAYLALYGELMWGASHRETPLQRHA